VSEPELAVHTYSAIQHQRDIEKRLLHDG